MVKNRYTAKLDERNEMEKIVRACIDDYKDDLWSIKTEMKALEPKDSNITDEHIKKQIKAIIDKEKQLTLIYD